MNISENGTNQRAHEQQRAPRWRITHRFWWNVITVAGLLYLVGIAINMPMGHFGQTEAIVFAAILLFNPALVEAFFDRIKSLSVSSKGIEVSLNEMKVKQEEQTSVLETLAFLLANYLPRAELEFLRKIAGDEREDSYKLNSGANVRGRLRRLRDAELIRKTDPAPIGSLPELGHLRDFFALTERGRTYIDLVRKVGTPRGAELLAEPEPVAQTDSTAAAAKPALPL